MLFDRYVSDDGVQSATTGFWLSIEDDPMQSDELLVKVSYEIVRP